MKTKIRVLNFLIGIIIISLVFTVSIFGYDFFTELKTKKLTKQTIQTFNRIVQDDSLTQEEKSEKIKIGNYNVIGKIKIDSIHLEYPILEEANPVSLKKSVCKLYGSNPNEEGNLCITGLTLRNETMFTEITKINKGDIIEITDLNNNTIKYEVYNTYREKKGENKYLESPEGETKIVTLSTYSENMESPYIVQAKEIN